MMALCALANMKVITKEMVDKFYVLSLEWPNEI